MPLPSPRADEGRDEFIHRCMGTAVMLEEYPLENVRAAVCNSQWGRREVKMMDWIPIFKTGFHSRSSSDRDWSIEDLDKMIASTAACGEDIPFVIGHPKKELLPWGKAEPLLKRIGDFLYAKPREISKAFKEVVKEGLNRISIKVDLPDMRIKHIGFFGPEETAVDLPGAAFMAGEEVFALEFSAPELEGEFDEGKKTGKHAQERGGMNMTLKERLLDIVGKVTDKDLEPATFTEVEVKAQVEKAAKQAKEEGIAEGKKAISAEFSEKERALKKGELATYVDELIKGDGKKGRALVAAKKVGLVELMATLPEEETIEFAEGDKTVKKSPLAAMKAILETLPADITFSEVATKDKDTGGADNKEKRDTLIQEFQEKNKDTSYKEAVLAISKKHPELFSHAEE